jgi:hypothetical protein
MAARAWVYVAMWHAGSDVRLSQLRVAAVRRLKLMGPMAGPMCLPTQLRAASGARVQTRPLPLRSLEVCAPMHAHCLRLIDSGGGGGRQKARGTTCSQGNVAATALNAYASCPRDRARVWVRVACAACAVLRTWALGRAPDCIPIPLVPRPSSPPTIGRQSGHGHQSGHR